MIRIETPPMLQGKPEEQIKELRNYLLKEMESLQRQINMLEDELKAGKEKT